MINIWSLGRWRIVAVDRLGEDIQDTQHGKSGKGTQKRSTGHMINEDD
jgi:hypothetical protein